MIQLRRLDWVLNGALIFLVAASLISLASTAPDLFLSQLLWSVIGLVIIFFVSHFDWRPFINYPWVVWGFYFLSIGLLVLTYLAAPEIRGVRGWLTLGPLQFQTSEFSKFVLIFLYSYIFAKLHVSIARPKNLIMSFGYCLIPVGLVLLQPDLGSALILLGIWFGYLLVSGIRWKHLAIIFCVAAISFGLMWASFLKPYQKERITGLFNPERDPLGINYSVIQSKIAIGSAGFFGKGFGQGAQSHLGFLPEAQTDFIFAAFIEEWGMFGGGLIIISFILVLFRIMRIGLESENNFSKLVCLGTTILFLLHLALNVGSNLGLLPVIGVSFPFLSYGGSNFLLNSLLIGVVQSISVHRRF